MNNTQSPNKEITTHLKPEQEVALMRLIADGDQAAFDELARRYGGLIYATVFKVLKHVEDSRDVSQEVLLSIWNKAHTYEPKKGKLMTWLATMSRNRAIDRVRSLQRRGALRDKLQEQAESESPEPRESGRDVLYRSETRRLLENAVSYLSSEQREVIELAYFSGLTQSQIAEKLKRPIGTVKARIRRGIRNLRSHVKHRFNGFDDLNLSGLPAA